MRRKPQTILTHHGRSTQDQYGFVNAPIVRGSTVVFENYAQLQAHDRQYSYGRHGNPTNDAVQSVVNELEGAKQTLLAPSGVCAISTVLLALAKAGDHVLITDSAYEPTRQFADLVLTSNNIEVEYFDPRAGAAIKRLVRDNTRAVFTESPGSLTFEIQDLPAIASVLAGTNIALVADNSWATPLYCKPLELGADIVIHAGTKMFAGHSDVMFGTISSNEKYARSVHATYRALGICVSPDDSFLVARGLRTLSIRMNEHQNRALEIAKFLELLPAVEKVFHPALEQHPDHQIFRRDFSGSGSLFSFTLKKGSEKAVAAFLDNLSLFRMGYSWGGFESLILPVVIRQHRTATVWDEDGSLFRIHVGMEDIEDLKSDLLKGIERYQDALA